MKFKHVLGALVAMTCSSQAATISVTFNESTGGHPSQQIATTTAAGIDSQMNWNRTGGVSGTLGALNDSTGAATTASVTWTSGGVWGDGNAETDALAGNGNAQVARGYLDDGGTGADWTVSSIPYALYDVHIYYSTDADGGTYRPTTVNGTAFSPTAPKSRYVSPGTWDATNSITVTGLSGDFVVDNLPRDGANRASIAGFQIVETIPEPSGSMLVAVGGLALIFRRRR